MCTVSTLILLAFALQAHAEDLAGNHNGDTQDFTDKLVDMLFNRVSKASFAHVTDLDGVTLGKASTMLRKPLPSHLANGDMMRADGIAVRAQEDPHSFRSLTLSLQQRHDPMLHTPSQRSTQHPEFPYSYVVVKKPHMAAIGGQQPQQPSQQYQQFEQQKKNQI